MADPLPRFAKRHASFNSPREIPLEPSTSRPTSPSLDSSEPQWLDRYSTASLPLPCQIPFYALPASTDRSDFRSPEEESSESCSSSSGDASLATSSSSFTTPDKPTLSDPETTPNNDPSRPTSPFDPHPQPQPTPEYIAMCRFMATPQIPEPPSSYPPPEPPTILPLDPPDNNCDDAQPSSRPRPPYVPFLSPAPPPPDSWIEVETTVAEYRLHVRLPGFTREGITLATKRRRILHVVADRWDEGGGHFERRISFGYDADLVQVRAEFDGVMLKIVIPRRASPVECNPPPRLAPFGRT